MRVSGNRQHDFRSWLDSAVGDDLILLPERGVEQTFVTIPEIVAPEMVD
jgi:hypothetical protein